MSFKIIAVWFVMLIIALIVTAFIITKVWSQQQAPLPEVCKTITAANKESCQQLELVRAKMGSAVETFRRAQMEMNLSSKTITDLSQEEKVLVTKIVPLEKKK